MKKLLLITTVVLFTFGLSGLALAQITLNDTQTGGAINPGPGPGTGLVNYLNISQAANSQGGPLTINLTQTAGTYNTADSKQKGAGPLITTVMQTAGAENIAITEQGFPGHASYYAHHNWIDVDQTAGGFNYAEIRQKLGFDWTTYNDFRVKQVAGGNNVATIITTDWRNTGQDLAIDQNASAGNNFANLYVEYRYSDLVRASNTGTPEALGPTVLSTGPSTASYPATQISTGGNNTLWTYQRGYNTTNYNIAGLYQSAAGDNFADIYQDAWGYAAGKYNTLGVYQVAGGGNILWADQLGQSSTAKVVQDAATNNFADVIQDAGTNKLVGADSDATINAANPANQISANADNTLLTYQSGDNNGIGLYQSADDYNFSDISQTNDNNTLGVYQTNGGGFNSLQAEQSGNMQATVIQTTVSGNGTISVIQN